MILSWEQGPLAEALLHFLWQGTLVAFVTGSLLSVLKARSAQLRYRIGLLGLLIMAAAPLATLYLLSPTFEAVGGSDEVRTLPVGPSEINVIAGPTLVQPPAVPSEASGLAKYYPWIVGGWSAGVLLCGLRLLCGFVGLCRWSWRGTPVPMEMKDTVQRLSKALTMRAPRVFLSPRVPEALALGILRPLILAHFVADGAVGANAGSRAGP